MPSMLRNCILALCASLFGSVTILGLVVYGDPATRKTAILAGFCACLSQFVAQDVRRIGQIANIVLAYIAFALAIVAIWML